MIDPKFKRYPNFNTILSTCRRNPSREEYQLCYNSFIPLLKRFQENSYTIDNEYLKQLGFPIDVDLYRREVQRTATVAHEYLQRCKCLTHPTQKDLREARISSISKLMSDKRKQANNTIARVLADSESAVKKICEMMGTNDTDLAHLRNATLDHFSKLKGDYLKAFILTRDVWYQTKSKLPNKGSLADAEAGQVNMISISFNCRTNENYGKYSQTVGGVEEEEAVPNVEVDRITV